MNRPITPLRAASLGILLVALWLIILGVWNTLCLVYVFQDMPRFKVTSVTIFLTILWKTLPFSVGIVLFSQHRFLVYLFYGHVASNTEGRKLDSWHDTRTLATLLIGLLGLFLTARSLDQFCNENIVQSLILAIDNPQLSENNWDRLSQYMSILYPLVLGIVFVVGAGRIGNLMGRQIDKSLESSSTEEEKNRQ